MIAAARFALTMAWRESRAALGRLWLLTASVSLGVAALVAINSFTDDLRVTVRDQARNLLGADLSLGSAARFSDKAEGELRTLAAGADVSRVVRFAAMAYAPNGAGARLVQVTASDGGYPYYGTVVTSPPEAWARRGRDRTVLVDESLLLALSARVGETLALGDARFLIDGVVVSAPGDVAVRSAFGPRVFMSTGDLDETHLLGLGARARYEAYVKLPQRADAQRISDRHKASLAAERVSLRTVSDQGRDLDRTLGRLGRYLGLVALIALLLGGLGVASAAHVLVKRKLETAAVLRCLGASGRTVLVVYALQAAALGAVGSIVGATAGLGLQALLPRLLGDFLPVAASSQPSWSAAAAGFGVGVWTAAAFALLPLSAMRRVSPLVVLRRDQEAAGGRRDLLRFVVAGALGLTVLAIAMLQARSPVVGAVFAGAVGVVLGGLTLAARALMRALHRYFPRRWPYAWRQGVANLFRPANQTTAVVLALGFGAFLLNVVLLVQHNLLRDLRPGGGVGKPNVVVFDVQPDQRGPVARLLEAAGATPGESAPIVPMRIQSLKGRPVAARLAEDAGRPAEPGEGNAWALRREYRSTYRDTLGDGETVVAGERWATGSWKTRPTSDEAVPVSVEKGLADELDLALGDEIVWDVQGLAVRSRVAGLREVDWARFEPNFFVVFPEGPLDAAPQTYVTLARLKDAAARVSLQRGIAEAFPNVAVVDVTQVQEAVEGIVDRVSRAIRFISLFSLATGALVLLGALATSRYQRVREAVLLKTLGATRRQVLRIACIEYLGLGLLGASTALGLAVAAAWGLVRFVFDARFTTPVAPLLLLSLSVVGLTVAVGLLSSLDLFRRTPLAVLRAE